MKRTWDEGKELWERVKTGFGWHQVCIDREQFLGLMEDHQKLMEKFPEIIRCHDCNGGQVWRIENGEILVYHDCRFGHAAKNIYERFQARLEQLQAENLRLKAPLTPGEIQEFFHKDDWNVDCVYKNQFAELITARATGPVLATNQT